MIMKKQTAEKPKGDLQQGADTPALNTHEIAALRELHCDGQLDFYGELPALTTDSFDQGRTQR
jgi:hypothetical protein